MKFCTHCGTQLNDDVKFCFICGLKQPLRSPQSHDREQHNALQNINRSCDNTNCVATQEIIQPQAFTSQEKPIIQPVLPTSPAAVQQSPYYDSNNPLQSEMYFPQEPQVLNDTTIPLNTNIDTVQNSDCYINTHKHFRLAILAFILSIIALTLIVIADSLAFNRRHIDNHSVADIKVMFIFGFILNATGVITGIISIFTSIKHNTKKDICFGIFAVVLSILALTLSGGYNMR